MLSSIICAVGMFVHLFWPCWERHTVNYLQAICFYRTWEVKSYRAKQNRTVRLNHRFIIFSEFWRDWTHFYKNSTTRIRLTATIQCLVALCCSSLFPVGIQGCKWCVSPALPDLMVLFTLWMCLPRAIPCALTLSGLTDEHGDRRWLLSIGGRLGWRWGNTIYNRAKSDWI